MEKHNLGAILNNDKSATLKVWSPSALEVSVSLFDKADCNILITENINMFKSANGIWEITLNSTNTNIDNMDGYFYQYKINIDGIKTLALDPYAKSMASFSPNQVDKIGKAAIVDINSESAGIKPVSIGHKHLVSPMEMISYEVHIRDFTIGTDVEHRGTYKAFTNFEKGIDHIKDLGITHVQFLPIHNFYTVDEKNKDLSGGGVPYNPNYNWGYDPHNYFTPEGWYSTNPADPYSRIREFRELINKLHQNGIGVIMDVVYNHTYMNSILHNVAPKEYYRKDGGATPVGDSAVASEKPMVRKLIVDSLKYFVDEFGIDGFRFDLMGFIDSKTMEIVRETLGEDIILYGEAWNFTDLDPTTAPVKGITNIEHHKISNLAYFNDTSRDSYAGVMEYPGFVQGNYYQNGKCKAGIIAGLVDFDNGGTYLDIDKDPYNRFAKNPEETLQYLTIHDGFTLWDKINISHKGSKKDKIAVVKQAIAMLFTSQGKIAVHAGSEIARTKPLGQNDPEPTRVNSKTENIYDEGYGVFFHENSYRSPDYTNMIRWDRKDDPDFYNLFKYYKGLITLRRSIPAFRYYKAESIRNGLQFFGDTKDDESPNSYISFTLDNTLENFGSKTDWKNFIIIHNARKVVLNLKCDQIENDDDWGIIVDGESAGITTLLQTKIVISNGIVSVPAHTSVVLAKY